MPTLTVKSPKGLRSGRLLNCSELITAVKKFYEKDQPWCRNLFDVLNLKIKFSWFFSTFVSKNDQLKAKLRILSQKITFVEI